MSTPVSMSAAMLALLVIGLLAAKNDIAQARGIHKVVALTPCASPFPWRPSARNIFPAESP